MKRIYLLMILLVVVGAAFLLSLRQARHAEQMLRTQSLELESLKSNLGGRLAEAELQLMALESRNQHLEDKWVYVNAHLISKRDEALAREAEIQIDLSDLEKIIEEFKVEAERIQKSEREIQRKLKGGIDLTEEELKSLKRPASFHFHGIERVIGRHQELQNEQKEKAAQAAVLTELITRLEKQ